MWPRNFSERLESWAQLRQQCRQLDPELALIKINAWWFQTPWTAYHLHWDDQQDWPDPWQWLSDDQYCPVARGLGIMYTISMLDREDLPRCPDDRVSKRQFSPGEPREIYTELGS